jgi:hypothetical protein
VAPQEPRGSGIAPDDEQATALPGSAGEGQPSAEVGDGGARRFVAETVRKAVLTGLGAVFLTEEGARKLARDWKLPKDIVGYVAAQAGSAKDEIVRVVSEEVRKFFESEALRREFLRVLTSMSIEVHAEISLKPSRGGKMEAAVKVGGVKPKIRRGRDDKRDDKREEKPGEAEGDGEG